MQRRLFERGGKASGFADDLREIVGRSQQHIDFEATLRSLGRVFKQALPPARLSLEFATSARPLMHFSDIDLPEFLVRRAEHAAIRLIPDWAQQFSSFDDSTARELCRTIYAFADCNFNVKQTAQRLSVHANTVYFRLNRINKLTGIDPRTYSGTLRLLTALRLFEIHHGERRDS